MSRDRCALLCIHGDALEIPAVTRALRDRWSVEAVHLDPARFPTGFSLSLDYAGGEFGWSEDGREGTAISAVWQGVVAGRDLPAMDPATRRTCAAAAEMALLGLIDSAGAFQLDPRWRTARAENKPYQLRVAQAVGLEIPATVVTNDPRVVRDLAARRGPIIAKMLVQPITPEPGEEGGATVVFTSALGEADLADLSGLELCPMIFQEQIANQLDVRVTIAGRCILAAAIDASARAGSDIDWRQGSHARGRGPSWAPYDLPAAVGERLVALCDRLGLNYGACDLVVEPGGRHVFLELNPSGSFSFLGPEQEAAIAAAIADVLVDPGARRIPAHV
jgi:glutathione synthase/RimK-type ligase-like ATP-grasp enzyme